VSRSDASIIVVPPTLNPGDSYRLVFLTSTARDATSTNIVDYNNFVSTAANSVPELAALGASWTAIGTTAAMTAFDNIGGPFSEGVYRLDGGLVAVGSVGLWDSSTHTLPVDITELGATAPNPTQVRTGTLPDGSGGPSDYRLGGSTPVYGLARTGSPLGIGPGWVFQSWDSSSNAKPFYGISSTLTVPAGGSEVPEPGTVGLSALGGALLFLASRRK
jgi:hypothetical protein